MHIPAQEARLGLSLGPQFDRLVSAVEEELLQVEIRGKGQIETWLLRGRDGSVPESLVGAELLGLRPPLLLELLSVQLIDGLQVLELNLEILYQVLLFFVAQDSRLGLGVKNPLRCRLIRGREL